MPRSTYEEHSAYYLNKIFVNEECAGRSAGYNAPNNNSDLSRKYFLAIAIGDLGVGISTQPERPNKFDKRPDPVDLNVSNVIRTEI